MISIRDEYVKYGMEEYYKYHCKDYYNPHEKAIDNVLEYVYNNWKDIGWGGDILDLACGKGAVTKSLYNLGISNIIGLDGYLYKEYEKHTGNRCISMTFDEIISGKLGGIYSTIVCSFAMHLVEESKLPMFLYALSCVSDNLVIISPHKRPIIKDDWYWELSNEVLIERVRCRYYKKNI